MPQPARQSPSHEDIIINFRLKGGPEKKALQTKQMHTSMAAAERNFEAILTAADQIAIFFANFQRFTTFNTAGIANFIRDLRTIFGILRRRHPVKEGPQPPRTDDEEPPPRVPREEEPLPQRILQDAYQCLCPLTMLLQSVAQCLGDLKVNLKADLNVHVPSDTEKSWGAIEPLRRILVQMEPELDENEHTGLAACIMFHENHSRYVVTSTAPRYQKIPGLQTYAYVLRHKHLENMRNSLPPRSRARVEQLEAYSENLKTVWNKQPKEGRTWTGGPPPVVENITGCNATFGTTGGYMTACLLDDLRFQMSRPEMAQGKERSENNRGVHGPFSCAEWELFITLLSRPDPGEPRPLCCVGLRNGMPKARTWESNKAIQRPPGTTNAPPRPSPLPAYPKPTAQRVGMGKSSTFANHPQLQRHEAAGQVIIRTPTRPQKPPPQALPSHAPNPTHGQYSQRPPQVHSSHIPNAAHGQYSQLPEKKKAKSRRCCF